MYYGYSGKITAQPGKRDELVNILLAAAVALESNEACVHYLVSVTDHPDEIFVRETWTTKEAHDASLEPEEVKAVISSAMPLIAGMSDQLETAILGGKGV